MAIDIDRDNQGYITELKIDGRKFVEQDRTYDGNYFFVVPYKYLLKMKFRDLPRDEEFKFYIVDSENYLGINRKPTPHLAVEFKNQKPLVVLSFLLDGMRRNNKYIRLLNKTLYDYGRSNPELEATIWKRNSRTSPSIKSSKKFKSFKNILIYAQDLYKKIVEEIEEKLRWDLISVNEFDKEEQFTKEIIIPLFKNLDFENVRYNGGQDEFGKDVICLRQNELGLKEFWGIQVKNEDVKGSVKSDLNTIINQIDDAFKVPFNSIETGKNEFISRLVIAINGSFTKNALEKIVAKIPTGVLQNNVFFLDKERIEYLIKRAI